MHASLGLCDMVHHGHPLLTHATCLAVGPCSSLLRASCFLMLLAALFSFIIPVFVALGALSPSSPRYSLSLSRSRFIHHSLIIPSQCPSWLCVPYFTLSHLRCTLASFFSLYLYYGDQANSFLDLSTCCILADDSTPYCTWCYLVHYNPALMILETIVYLFLHSFSSFFSDLFFSPLVHFALLTITTASQPLQLTRLLRSRIHPARNEVLNTYQEPMYQLQATACGQPV